MNYNFNKNIIIFFVSLISGTGLLSYLSPNNSIYRTGLITILMILIFLSFYSLFNGFAFKPYLNLSWKAKIAAAFFNIIFSIIIFFSLQGSRLTIHNDSVLGIGFISLAAYLSLSAVSLFFIACIINLSLKSKKTEDENVPRIKIVFYAIFPLLIFFLYFIAFYPAVMTSDSLDQWSQTITHNFNDWHPVAHTWFIMLTTSLWKSPAAFVIIQIFIFSLVIGYMCYSFEKSGVNKLAIYFTLAFMALIPVNGIYSITIWKDILYSVLLCLFTIILFNIINSGGEWLYKKINVMLFLTSSLGMSLFRHNGILVFSITIIIFLIIFRKRFFRLYIFSGMVIFIYIIITSPIYNHYNIPASDPNEALAIPTQQIASVIALDGGISAEQSAFFNSILPTDLWKANYNPYSVDPLKFNEEFNREFLNENKKMFFNNWLSLVINNPKIAIESYLKQTSVIWQINQFDDGVVTLYATSIYPKETGEQMGISSNIISKGITSNITRLLDQTSIKPNLVIWRPAIYTLLIILLAFTLILRGQWRKALIVLPILLNTAMLLVAIPAQDFRYLYANLLIVGVVFLCSLTKENNNIGRT